MTQYEINGAIHTALDNLVNSNRNLYDYWISELFSDANGDYLNEFSMDLIKHVQYWIIPLVGRDFDSDELFTGFRIELEKDGSTFHIENLHIK